MSASAIGGIVFAVVFGGALLGMRIRAIVPEDHLSHESRDVIKLGMGLIGTMAALVLSLLISSAKTSFDTRVGEVNQMTANVMRLDRTLAHYGAETDEARDLLRRSIVLTIAQLWPQDASAAPPTPDTGLELLHEKIQALSPHDRVQRTLQTRALTIATNLAQTRWMLAEQGERAVPMPFLVVLVLWLAVILMSFGLFVRRNLHAVVALFVCALAFSSEIFMVLERDQPFDGLIRISSARIQRTVEQLGR